ncbi:putative Permease of the major facilitator superfamily [Vibrio nigripulchritudo SFn27]|uniref:Putative Permease of the major facilitator superfamily n=1 Tax=Vibrio nigripulchritudo TaxID=28173 RepID=U4KH23_9VIBR|nr:MFS transporter [Vibrio nigripulchritudo]CCN81485.1 putative Permease of the major facilitator superfamily [Vibrio nigripulchritudo BLFn1]CCN91581.1 putative Permease of the major facilitator superfamily [Vibrio nigripulchritudo SFn27]CCN96466.1 putative Permease of the major facilitator superfamily [Vibrio nigripulchritudo ENn2]CCO38339.1 putative Permease of the major facilitator superfamily [Vibrio nigripulchritudo SFn135]CCO53796.1 putative Permease of the major facilitator superfamily 
MENTPTAPLKIFAPVVALSLFAVASGYLMSIIPLMLNEYGMSNEIASWIASSFYAGLLIGAVTIEPLVAKTGHKYGFVACLAIFAVTIGIMPLFANAEVWIFARLVAGMAVAGVFVIVESWLLAGSASGRAKRLGIYMTSLYGGSSLGQLGISVFGVTGLTPFVAILSLVFMAMGALVLLRSTQPTCGQHGSMSMRQILLLSKPAIVGCVVSGLVLGAIYGLMPLELTTRDVELNHVGSLMALVILGGMVVQPIASWLLKYAGRTLLLALFSFIGAGAIALLALFESDFVMASSLFVLGMASFALYPIAINLGCDNLAENHIVSATQVMLFSYSVGSVFGPVVADLFLGSGEGLMGYLFITLLATSLYMLVVSVRHKPTLVAGE